MKATRRPDGPTALDLIEEATHLVRCVPLACAAAYVTGVVPFLLGATFFVADMSRGAYAALHLPGAALGLVVLFAWMKLWQAIAAEQALAHLEQRPPGKLSWSGWLGLASRQFCAHAFGLVLLPLALVAALPGGWVYAYFQNVTVLGVSSGPRTHRVAWEQARLWPGQNHGALGAVSLLGLVVLANIAIAIYLVPMLVRTITGTERVFAQTGWNPLNTTFLAAVFALGFLVLDPVLKAFYVLRCFYGSSRRTGVDLLVQVRTALGRAALVLAIASVILSASAGSLRADDAAAAPAEGPRVEAPSSSVPPATDQPDALQPGELDAALDQVLEDPEYIWREPAPTHASGAASDFAKWIQRAVESIAAWLRRLFGSDEGGSVRGASGFGMGAAAMRWIFIIAILVLVGMVAMMILKRSEDAKRPASAAVAVAKTPALDREDLTADLLPEEEWMRIARELIARGEVRLGLRALYLGSLAALAGRGLLVLARHKSNRDYERELLRRGAPLGAVVVAFSENRREFEGVWYGDRRPDAEAIARFEQNVRVLVRRDAA